MGVKVTNILFFASIIWVLSSCSVTKKLEEDELYLRPNKYKFEDESPFKNELNSYVTLKPNSRLFGFIPVKDWSYNQVPARYDSIFKDYYSYSTDERSQEILDSLFMQYGLPDQVGSRKWVLRQFYRAGARPAVLDTAATQISAREIDEYYFQRGYFDAEVEPSYHIDSAAQRARVVYNIDVKGPSIISEYNQVIEDAHLEQLYAENLEDSKIEVNERFDVRSFERERDRLTEIFENNGYYNFNELGQELIFKIDSTNRKELKTTMQIAKPASDSIGEFRQYYIGEIDIYVSGKKDSTYSKWHRGYILNSDEPFKLNPRVYTDAITLNTGDLYRKEDIAKTRSLIFDRENFSLVGLTLEKNPDNPLDTLLRTEINLRHKDKYNLELSFEAMYSQLLNFGISPGVRFLTRNIFKGGENLEVNLRGTVGTVNSVDNPNAFFNAYELSFETRLNFPRWLLPFNSEGLVPKKYNPKSSMRLGLAGQRNIGLGSLNYNANLDYSWQPGYSSHNFELFNFEYIRNTERDKYYRIFTVDAESRNSSFDAYFDYSPDVEMLYASGEITEEDVEFLIYDDDQFIESLPRGAYNFDDYTKFRNIIFKKNSIIQDVLIQSFAHTFIYNENRKKFIKHPWYIAIKGEVAGAFLRLLDSTFGFEQQEGFLGERQSMIGGVPYSEFVRLDLDLRKTIQISPRTELAFRSFTGLALPYGNISTLPFSRSYFGGGSNDVRAWQAYELSPNPLRPNDDGTYIDQMKITWNAEYRFPIVGIMNGAVFVDAGNIWSLDDDNLETKFRFNQFLSQMGVGAGLGARFDLTFVIARLDFAWKMHDPAYAEGERWVPDFKILRPQIQFGINYPF
ncbi:BamA/TamA family outer membrane protein [Flavobacteriaceae bacterium Ap0902]|nr:BamA/TamA family outer membrane protein [Flavobacteriaceae bacterium Ap0902]